MQVNFLQPNLFFFLKKKNIEKFSSISYSIGKKKKKNHILNSNKPLYKTSNDSHIATQIIDVIFNF